MAQDPKQNTNTTTPEVPAPARVEFPDAVPGEHTAPVFPEGDKPAAKAPAPVTKKTLKAKWQAHVDKNKALAKDKKNVEQIDTDRYDLDEVFENFDPKFDKKKLTPQLRKKIIDAEKMYHEGVVSIKDLVSPSSMEISTKGLSINNMHVKSFYVFNYPRYLESNWLNQIINFDATMNLSLFIYPTDSARMMRILRKKVTQMRATRHMKADKGIVNDVGLDTALEDAEQLRVDLQRGKERFFQFGMYFTVYAETPEKLNSISKQIETILGGLMVMSRPAHFQTERAFNSTLPQCTDELETFHNMNTGPLSTSFPFVSSSLTSDEGILYGLNRHNNSLIIFDRFNLENANSVIFAKSGAGKSYAVKLEILRSSDDGTLTSLSSIRKKNTKH